MSYDREGFWTFAVAAVVALLLLDVVGFAQAKVKKKNLLLSSFMVTCISVLVAVLIVQTSLEAENVDFFYR